MFYQDGLEVEFGITTVNDQQISFRSLQREDLALLHQWLCADHVFIWYKDTPDKPTLAAVEQKYLPRILGESKTTNYIIMVAERPIGQIQMYKIDDYPEYKHSIQITDNAAGVDLFIGEEDYLHKGFGTAALQDFLKNYVFAKLDVDSCVMGPNPDNVAAIKAYEKAGLKHFKTIFTGKEEEYLMRIEKQDMMQHWHEKM